MCKLGHVPQSVTCLTADPGVASSIPARSHTFVEIDHEIISTTILLPSVDSRRVAVSYKRKYVHKVSVNTLVKHVHVQIYLDFDTIRYCKDNSLSDIFPSFHHGDRKAKYGKTYQPLKALIWLQLVYTDFLCFVCLIFLYVPLTIFQLCRDRSSWVEPVIS